MCLQRWKEYLAAVFQTVLCSILPPHNFDLHIILVCWDFLFCFCFCPCSMQHLSSPTRDPTCCPAAEVRSLNHWTIGEFPSLLLRWISQVAQMALGQEYPLEKEMATHSSILAWRFPRTEEPGELLSMG